MATPTQPVPGQQPRPPSRPDLTAILGNLGSLLKMDQEGKLSPLQVNQLRQLISTQSRSITYQYVIKSQPNPLTTLTGHLNPTNPWENGPPLMTTEKYSADIQLGMGDAARHIKTLLPSAEMRELVKMDAQERGRIMEADLVRKTRFQATVTYYTEKTKATAAAAALATAKQITATASQGINPNTDPNSNTNLNTNPTNNTQQTLASAMGQSQQGQSLAPGSMVNNTGKPFQLHLPVVAPVESEVDRRKRKFGEYLAEAGPGMEYEQGVKDILSQILDSFMIEGTKGAIRLAKHRKSQTVDVKDVAFFLDNTYGITVPGFNAPIAARSHAQFDEGKRRRGGAVAPKAARAGRTNGGAAGDDVP